SPRILWAGVEDPSSGLRTLQQDIERGVRELGFKIEDRPFKPHLTLGRVRSGFRADELTSAMAFDKNTNFGVVEVKHVLLMQSQMGHQGVRYTVIHESALKGA
ncbi:MAG: RNA 2',3'-cyclic phosphodiesterase, partial [Lentisphaerota bacterium]